MENQHHEASDRMAASQFKLRQYYVDHLSKIYCTYSHLAERLSELTGNQQFEGLSIVIDGLIVRSASQLELLEHIYQLIGEKPSVNLCAGLTQFLEDNFGHIQQLSYPMALFRSFIISYLQYSNSILVTSFQLVQHGIETVFSSQVCNLINALLLLAEKENAISSVFV